MVPAATAQSCAVGPPSRAGAEQLDPVPRLLGGARAEVDDHLVHADPAGDAERATAHPHGTAGLLLRARRVPRDPVGVAQRHQPEHRVVRS